MKATRIISCLMWRIMFTRGLTGILCNLSHSLKSAFSHIFYTWDCNVCGIPKCTCIRSVRMLRVMIWRYWLDAYALQGLWWLMGWKFFGSCYLVSLLLNITVLLTFIRPQTLWWGLMTLRLTHEFQQLSGLHTGSWIACVFAGPVITGNSFVCII